MKRVILGFVLMAIVTGSAAAQNKKTWTEWDKTEVDKMLNASPWGQTQTDTDTSQMVWTPKKGIAPVPRGSNQEMTVNYRLRLFSARPIREAFVRNLMLANAKIVASQFNSFINSDYSESIVVAVTFDGADRSYTGIVGQAFDGASTGTLKNKAYLERKDGKQIYLDEYAAPSTDGTGAKFVFPRNVDGKAFFEGTDGSIRFVADMGRGVKVVWKFKISELMYDGRLEY